MRRRSQRGPQHGAVVERMHDAGDLLTGLVALARDEHGVAGAGRRPPRRWPRRGRRPRAPRPRCAAGTASAPASMARADRGRILRARVVVGDDQHVGAARGHLAHHRPLAAVAVAAAAEHDDQPAGGERPQRRAARPRPRPACGCSRRRPGTAGRRRCAPSGRARSPRAIAGDRDVGGDAGLEQDARASRALATLYLPGTAQPAAKVDRPGPCTRKRVEPSEQLGDVAGLPVAALGTGAHRRALADRARPAAVPTRRRRPPPRGAGRPSNSSALAAK